MPYKFTNQLPKLVCRMCGATFTEKWSVGGIGAVCEKCYPKRDELDLVEAGLIRNIKEVHTSNGLSYEFKALIDDVWYGCHRPCGDWAYVDGYLTEHNIFSVPVGWWELADLYARHGATDILAKRCYSCNNEIQVYFLESQEKATAKCQACGVEGEYRR